MASTTPSASPSAPPTPPVPGAVTSPPAAGPWLAAFAAAGFTVAHESTWTADAVARGEAPSVLEVPTPAESVALALVVDEDTGAVFVVPADPSADRAAGSARFTTVADDRGVVGLLARLLVKGPGRKVINVVVGKLAQAAAAAWEARARAEQARWFRPADAADPGVPLTGDDWRLLARGPSLLWLHGPLVQANTGFAGFDAELWNRLAERYDGRCWAYDHQTVSKSPKANAADLVGLAQAAGAPLVVDVIAHSRGGLVARELVERLRDGPLQVRSLLLAGTPNLGTPLADPDNLVGCVNRLTNLLALIPNPIVDIADAVVAVMTEVVGQAYGALPGITAMRPAASGGDPTYLSELDALGRPADVVYRLIGSDYQPQSGSKLGHAFEGWTLDTVLHDKANDLVVPSMSATGTTSGQASDRLTVHDAPHTGYWRSPEVAERVHGWLLGAPAAATGTPPTTSLTPPATPPTPSPTPPTPSATPATPPTPDAPTVAAPVPPPVLVGPPPAVAPTPLPTPVATTHDPAGPGLDPAADDVDLPPFVVGIRHASLEHAPYTLIVGHFAGAPITGAEARLDERLGGRLTRLQLLGQSPRQIGESMYLQPVDGATPPGVLVVGLGPTGELTATQLNAVVTRALLKLASYQLEVRVAREREHSLSANATGRPRPSLGVSSVLIGSSYGGGLTIEGSIRALLGGVTAANERLRRLRVDVSGTTVAGASIVHFERLELIERYADRVDLVAAALARLADLEDRQREGRPPKAIFIPRPIMGEGAANGNPPLDNAEEVWRRVSIAVQGADDETAIPDTTASGATRSAAAPVTEPSAGFGQGPEIAPGPDVPGQLTLRFTSMGRLARAERLVSVIEPAIVQPLIDDAISRDADPDVSGTLFELLVPDLLKGELNDGENLHLLLDDTTAVYPWELLAARSDDVSPQLPLSLRVGVLRQFLESQDVRHDIRRASADSILVVGNPPPGPGLNPLPAAAQEATDVAALFGAHAPAWSVEAMVWDANGQQTLPTDRTLDREPGEHVLHRLLNGDWRIVHVAAHGQITDEPSTTGVVMGGRFYLTANVFERLSVVPDVVFLNSCYLGSIAPRSLRGMNRLAAGVAEALLRIGVRAVIVAGWAVNDRAASAFAKTLYGELFAGRHLGDAVSAARTEAKRAAPHAQTWGAYQCYGDPGFRLVALTPAMRTTPAETSGELRRRIQRLAAAASDQGRGYQTDEDGLLASRDEQLRDLEACAVELRSAGALSDLADVHAELGQLPKAAELYQQALQRGGGDVPVRAIEQVGNMLIRDSQQRVRDGAAFADVEPDVDRALRWLSGALSLGETGERLALLGSYHKRCATMTEGEERRGHLEEALDHYARAEQVKDDAYYWNNWLQLYHVAGLLGSADLERWSPPAERPVPVAGAAPAESAPAKAGATDMGWAAAPPPEAETFWDRARVGDDLLTAGIVSGQLDGNALVDAYDDAFRLRSSERERASVVDHLHDLADLLPSDHPLGPALVDAFARLRGWKP